MDLTDKFNEFYDEYASEEQKDTKIDFSKPKCLERAKVLKNLYLRGNCEFIYKKACSTFDTGCAETLVQYLLDELITINNPDNFLVESLGSVKEYFTFKEIVKEGRNGICAALNFNSTSICTFFSDILSIMGTQYMNGVSCNLLDFNLFIYLMIAKTKKLKNNSDIWDGVDISKCEEYSESTRVGFRIFRYQYNAQIVNTIISLLRMAVSIMTIKDGTIPNLCSFGLLDRTAIDLLGKEYVYNNGTKIIRPDADDIKRYNIKILGVFEKGSNPNVSRPNLNVYLCYVHSVQYLITKSLASFFGIGFNTMNNALKVISDWDNLDELAPKLYNIVKGYGGADITDEMRLRKVNKAVENSRTKLGTVLDTELLNLCSKYYIPNMNYVLYDWNGDMFKPSFSEVTIDYNKIRAVVDDESECVDFLRELYNAGQKINLMRKFVLDIPKGKYLKVNILNVDRDRIKDVNDMLREETKSLKSYWSERFSYVVTLNKDDFLEQAKINSKTNYNRDVRDYWKKKYKKIYKGKGIIYPSRRKFMYNKFESHIKNSPDYHPPTKRELLAEMELEKSYMEFAEDEEKDIE